MTIYFLKPWCWANTNYLSSCVCFFFCVLLGPVPVGDYRIGSNFWKFYLIKTDFTLGDPISLVKMFRLEWIFLGVQSVDTVPRCTTSCLLAGPACLWCLVELAHIAHQFSLCVVTGLYLLNFFDHGSIKCVGSEMSWSEICITDVISHV
jgi:hypothetical protein